MDTDLFGYAPDPHANLLPYDGIVNDYGVVLNLVRVMPVCTPCCTTLRGSTTKW